MGTRSKRAVRCEGCRMHQALCLCSALPCLDLATRILLIMHRREVAKTTATAHLALKCLPNSELLIHGHQDDRLDLQALNVSGARRVLALFPADEATPLSPSFLARDNRPVTLIVPDGSWRQASKALRRIPGLAAAERVTLPAGPPTRYRLRREPKQEGLSTFEAIARALGIIESPEVEKRLGAVLDRMVEGTLATRGQHA